MFAYSSIKKRYLAETRKPLPRKEKSNRLVAIYYNQNPDPADDALPFYLFRKNGDYHYSVIYFHPESKPVDADFVSQFDIHTHPLVDTWFCSRFAYSHYLTSKIFYMALREKVPEAEFYFIFQSDSFLIQEGLEQWMNGPFDYYGAVWEKGLIPGTFWPPSNPVEAVKDTNLVSKLKTTRVGNGGFTLRRIDPCFQVVQKFQIQQLLQQHEDTFYCMFGQLTGMRFAPIDLARKFSWEDPVAIGHYIGELKMGRPLGFHNIMSDMAELLIEDSLKS